MTTLTAGDMRRHRNAEPTPLHNMADTERLRAAATQALRILERTGLAPITAALLRAALVAFCRGLPLTERARCRT